MAATAARGSPSLTSASPTRTARAPASTNSLHVGDAEDPGLRDLDPVVGDQRREPGEGGVVDLEGLEVAVVDPDELGAQGDRALGLGLVVDLDERGEPELAGLVVEAAQGVVVQRADDQQGQVGAGGAGLDELVAGDDEVLAQHRYVDRGADRDQVGQAAGEAALLGQDADRGGPAGGVLAGQRRGVGDLGEMALAGAAALDLGDDRALRGTQARHRVQGRVDVAERRADVGERTGGLAHGEVLAHAGDDLLEHRHGASNTVMILHRAILSPDPQRGLIGPRGGTFTGVGRDGPGPRRGERTP